MDMSRSERPQSKRRSNTHKTMARRKRTSPAVDRASTRASSLKSIDAALDLGNKLTLAGYNKVIDDTTTLLNDYNTKLSELDGALTLLEEAESSLDELSNRMLKGVAVKFGENSTEYEQAGGTRTSERKAPERKAQPTPTK